MYEGGAEQLHAYELHCNVVIVNIGHIVAEAA
jgi:hypothetical protein